MSLYIDPVDEIYADIAKKNPGVNLVKDQYAYSTPVATSNLNGTNTLLTLSSININSAYDGSVTVRYKRLDLSSLQTMLPDALEVQSPNNTQAVASAITARYGVPFYEGDLVIEPYNLVGGTGTVRIRASSGSLRWIGQADFNIVPAKPALSSVVTVTTLPGYVYPYADITRPFAKMYSYWRDFSSAYGTLDENGVPEFGPLHESALLNGYDDPAHVFDSTALDDLATALVQVSNNAWTVTGVGRYSLNNAVIEYIGSIPNLPTTYRANHVDFTHVCVVTLDPTFNQGFNGELYMHFNII